MPRVPNKRPPLRSYTPAYRLRVLAEIDAAPSKAAAEEVLHREGLAPWLVSTWRRQRDGGVLRASRPVAVSAPPRPATDRSGGFVLSGERTPVGALVREVLAQRQLVVILARKEFFVRYRRASFGLAWAVLLPLVQAGVLALVLSRFVRFDTDVAYAVFVYTGMLAWSFVSNAVTASSTAIVDNASITSRIYFPRAVLPLMAVMSGTYGFVGALPVLLVLPVLTGSGLGPEIVLLAPAVLLAVALAAAAGLVLSVLHVWFRDVRFIVSAALMPLFYATPVFYPLEALEGPLRTAIAANPVTGVVQLFRVAIGEDGVALAPVAVSVAAVVGLGAVGLVLQARRDRVMADLL